MNSALLTVELLCATIGSVEEIKQEVEDMSHDLYMAAGEASQDCLVLNHQDLTSIIERQSFNRVAASTKLAQVRKAHKEVKREMEKIAARLYKGGTDKVLSGLTTGTNTRTKSVGTQKYDTEYRKAFYLNDAEYNRLRVEEEVLAEKVEILEAIRDAIADNSKFILGMQKAQNQNY